MEVFRLSRDRYARTLSGEGTARTGGRWNSPGVEMVYTAMNRSLAMAEVAVHLSLAMLPEDYRMITIDIPDRVSRHQLALKRLPANWKAFPHPAATRALGDRFIAEGKHCILIVPSAITQGDFNYLLNPRHPDFKKIRIRKVEAFPFDRRMVR